jgi:hypothetical protein
MRQAFRLGEKGYSQQPGVDYNDAFAPIAHLYTMRTIESKKDLGRPKNQIFWNRTKPVPLHSTCCANFSNTMFFTNGHRMRKLSHSDRFPKHAKSQTSQIQ